MHNSSDQPKQPSMQQILRLAQTPEGQRIIAMLKNNNDPQLQQAMAKAAQGDYSQAKDLLSSLLSSEDLQALMNKLGGS